MPWFSLAAAVSLVLVATAGSSHAGPFTQYYVFGDSLSDTGNLYDLSGGLFPRSGIYTTGRFTNGTDSEPPASGTYVGVWHEQLARMIDLTPATPSRLGGNNWAYGVAVTGPGTTTVFGFTLDNIGKQVGDFAARGPADPGALYILWGGGNDLINVAEAAPGGPQILFDEAALTAVAHQRDNVLTLAKAGARTFLIPNVADLGLTPAYRGSASQTQLSGASRLFRDHLVLELALLRDSLDITIHELDVFTIFKHLFEDPPPGVNVTQISQGRRGIDPDTYLWWDEVHPTVRGHSVLAEAAFPVVSTSCGGAVPCACGQRVVLNRTLVHGVDPVTTIVCPADGLIVASGVTLDLRGATLRGQGLGAGVRIEAGATQVTVKGGKVIHFATGVLGEGTTIAHLTNLRILDNTGDGVSLSGDGHTVEKAVIQRNGGRGVAINGNANQLSNLHAKSNGGAGVAVNGTGNTVTLLRVESNEGGGVSLVGIGNAVARTIATSNRGDGLAIQGASTTVDRNRTTRNGEAGLKLHGTEHTVTLNIAGFNTGTGLQMAGTTGSRIDRNRGENNRGFGITDNSAGTGPSGTANTYTGNICGRGNGAGASSPAGLCR